MTSRPGVDVDDYRRCEGDGCRRAVHHPRSKYCRECRHDTGQIIGRVLDHPGHDADPIPPASAPQWDELLRGDE